MNRCLTCSHWRRLKAAPHAGLCKRFRALAVGNLMVDEVLAMVPNPQPENFGLPTEGVITGFAFACRHHSQNPAETPEVGSFC